jgi:hypothetical protein
MNRAARRKEASMAKKLNARGVAELDLGTRTLKLKLTLRAMDEIETKFEIESIADLEEILQRPTVKQLAKLTTILAIAAGETAPDTERGSAEEFDAIAKEVRYSDCELADLVDAIGMALSKGQQPAAADEAGNAQAPSA